MSDLNGPLDPWTNLPSGDGSNTDPYPVATPIDPFARFEQPGASRPFFDLGSRQSMPVPGAEDFDFPVTPGTLASAPERRAQGQGAWDLIFGAVTQSILGEVVGGTVEGVGTLFEVGRDLFTGRSDWSNPLMEIGQGIREGVQEMNPVYMTENAQGAGWGRFADSTYWASHAPSIASTLSIMIPAMGVGRGALAAASGLSRVARGGRGLSEVAQTIVSTASATLASRHIENVLQGSQTFDQHYASEIENGTPEARAIELAGEAASRTYSLGYIQLLTDLPQYYAVTKGFSYANRNARRGLAEVARDLPASSSIGQIGRALGRTSSTPTTLRSLRLAGQGLIEGTEEFAQEFYVREGQRYANLLSGDEDTRTIEDRLLELGKSVV